MKDDHATRIWRKEPREKSTAEKRDEALAKEKRRNERRSKRP